MNQLSKTVACSNCQADVNSEATYCPFCAADLLTGSKREQEQAVQSDMFENQTLKDSLASLYKPPYSIRNQQGVGVPDEREESPFIKAAPQKEDPLFQPYEATQPPPQPPEEIVQEEPPEEDKQRGLVSPLLLLLVGTQLALLGLLILLFSKDGLVTLEWQSKHWFIYCLISAPLVFLGVRQLKRFEA